MERADANKSPEDACALVNKFQRLSGKKNDEEKKTLHLFCISPLIQNRRQTVPFNSRIVSFLTGDLHFGMKCLIKAQQKHLGREVMKR